jgi:hypothetical protein
MQLKSKYVVSGLAVATGITGLSFGALVGIFPDYPALFYDNQGALLYDPQAGAAYLSTSAGADLLSTGLLSVDASPIAIRFAPTEPPRFVNPTGDPPSEVLSIRARIDDTGLLFGGIANEDLIVVGEVDADGNGSVDYAGILLTGEVAEFGFLDSGGSTDQYDMRFTCTGGALADDFFLDQDIGVLITSESSTFTGSFTVGFGGGAKGILGPIPLRGDFEGCTAGYWKQAHHFASWPLQFSPDDLFEDIFDRDVLGAASPTLSEALRLKRGGLNALIRHATAALLNAAGPGVNTDPAFDTPAEVIAAFQEAFDSGDYETKKSMLEDSNEAGCPLN